MSNGAIQARKGSGSTEEALSRSTSTKHYTEQIYRVVSQSSLEHVHVSFSGPPALQSSL